MPTLWLHEDNDMTDDESKNVGGQSQLILDTRPRTKKPSMYKVVMLNDDFTPMDFVIHILMSLFFAFIILFNKKLFNKLKFLYMYLFLTIFLIFAIYLSSPHDIEFMVSTGLLRLMLEFSSPYLLFTLIFFKEKFKI